MKQHSNHYLGIWSLTVTSFAIGVAEFIVVGVLPAIATDFKISLARAGGLVGLYALDFTSALNISAFNLGITLGETLGSALVRQDYMALTPWAGVVLVLIAQLPLAWLKAR